MLIALLPDLDIAFKNRSRSASLLMFRVYSLIFNLDLPFVKKGKDTKVIKRIMELNAEGLVKLKAEFVEREINHLCTEAYKAYLQSL